MSAIEAIEGQMKRVKEMSSDRNATRSDILALLATGQYVILGALRDVLLLAKIEGRNDE